MEPIIHGLDFHREVPKSFANGFAFKKELDLKEQYQIGKERTLFVLNDGTNLFIDREFDYFNFYSNKDFEISFKTRDENIYIEFIG